ncbi:MAG: hypothetical protein QNK37_04925 [Acidobacteriota bacterium]|nr:hypothetical protein [Acidobacteriota bacterium]
MLKWLVWDGRYHFQGLCNQHYGGHGQNPEPKHMPPLILDHRRDAPVNMVIPDRVGVSLIDMVERPEGLALKIELHNDWFVRGLMLRVYHGVDREEMVYQEILDRDDILRLPDALPQGDAGMPPPAPDPSWIDELDGRVFTTPFRVRVWAANQPGSFVPWYGLLDWQEIEPRTDPGRMESHRDRVVDSEPSPDTTRCPHRIFMAAAGSPESVRGTLEEAARTGSPFTAALLRFAKPVIASERIDVDS